MRNRYIHLILACLIGSFAVTAQAAIEATTADGRKVILYSNGTWKYKSTEPITDSLSGGKGPQRTAVSDRGFVKIRYDANNWVYKRSPAGSTSEFSFKHKRGDGYAIAIIERISVPIDNLKQIALTNARNAAPNVRITHEKMRTVNGVRLLEMGMRGTIQGIPFEYLGYYWSGKSGSIQLITYTAQNLFKEYKKDFKKLLNGLTITKR